ncbi:MAG: TVP38/TMEM64 family protein [Selenomonadaceae bacterium]
MFTTDSSINEKPQSLQRKLYCLATLCIGLSIIYFVNPTPWEQIARLLLSGDLSAIIDYIRSFGTYAMLVSIMIVIFINVVAVLPNIFLLAANGIIFGIIPGTIISWLAESIGVIISFFIMRYFGQDGATALIRRSNMLKKVDDYSGKNGFKIMIIARSIPFIPSGLITALAALSEIPARDYILATLLGKFPSALIEVSIGHDLASYHDHMLRLTFFVLIAIGAYAAYIWQQKKGCRT